MLVCWLVWEDERQKMDFYFYENYSNLLVFMLRFTFSPAPAHNFQCTFPRLRLPFHFDVLPNFRLRFGQKKNK